MKTDNKMLIAGIGAIGGTFAYKFLKASYHCDLVTKNNTITSTINNLGISFKEENFNDNIHAHANTDFPEHVQYDYIFLMMKTTAVVQACQEIKEKNLLAENGALITVQNGDVYEFISDIFPNQIITCIIVWGASMLGPGQYELTSKGKTIIGDRNNKLDLSNLRDLLSKVSPNPVQVSNNIIGVVWSKLAINCAINSLAGISGVTLGELIQIDQGRKLFLTVYRETVELAKKQDIELEKLVSNPYLLYIPENTNFLLRFIKIKLIKMAGKKYGSVKPSMLQDIERGRPTEIDYLNGFVSQKAKDLNFKTPVNDKLTKLIKQIQDQKLHPEIKNLFLVQL